MQSSLEENDVSAVVRFRFSPVYLKRLQKAVGDPETPYKTLSDALRHAVHRHVEYLEHGRPWFIKPDEEV